jgi:hypothetical protein
MPPSSLQAPSSCSGAPSCSLLVVDVVGEPVHMAGGGEGRIVVGVHVVHRECDELTAAPPDGPEEEAGVQRVGEGGREHHDVAEIVTGFVEAKHGPHARWAVEVAIAGGEELAGKLERGPPPRDHPHAESVLHEHAGG